MHIKNTAQSKMRNELKQSETTWNEMVPTKNSRTHPHAHTHTHTHTHTHAHTQIIGGLRVCSMRTQWDIYDETFYIFC